MSGHWLSINLSRGGLAMNLDLRESSFAELIAFVFDHPPTDHRHDWFRPGDDAAFDEDLQVDPSTQVRHLATLFRDPKYALAAFEARQVDNGFWFIGVYQAECFLDQIWNFSVPRAQRLSCIAEVPRLYSELFLPLGLDEQTNMFGDFLTKHPCDPEALPAGNDAIEFEANRDALLSVFEHVLSIDDPRAQRGALHGIGHLRHHAGPKLAQDFLDTHADLSSDLRLYARAVARSEWIL
jgi:hypothetical protein